MAKLRPSKNKITLESAIAMTVLCLVLGTVFLTSRFFWYVPIEKEDTVQISAVYESYEYQEYSRKADILKLYFKDADCLFFNDSYISTELVEKIEALPEGTRLDMLLHPRSDDIIECKAEGKTLLDFEWATKRLNSFAVGHMILGLCMYGCGIYFVYHTIRLIRWHLKVKKSNK